MANDQAADLVDTELLKETGSKVEEVSGGCFCCRFPDMVAAMQRLVRQDNVDVLIGEPVGSCTDLSATVMQPLKQLHAHQFQVAPFSVLVDGNQVRVLARLRQAAAQQQPESGFPDNVLYIYEKQLEEADLIVLNKTDLLPPAELAELKGLLAERFPDTPLLCMSALSGEGVDAWLDFVGRGQYAGRKIAEVDYDTYAAGEAALGWMNAAAELQAAGNRLVGLRRRVARSDPRWAAPDGAHIAHLKLYLTSARGHVAGNVTSNDGPLSVRGAIAAGQRQAKLLLNARVQAQPDALRATVEQALADRVRRPRRGRDHQCPQLLPRPPAADAPFRAGRAVGSCHTFPPQDGCVGRPCRTAFLGRRPRLPLGAAVQLPPQRRHNCRPDAATGLGWQLYCRPDKAGWQPAPRLLARHPASIARKTGVATRFPFRNPAIPLQWMIGGTGTAATEHSHSGARRWCAHSTSIRAASWSSPSNPGWCFPIPGC